MKCVCRKPCFIEAPNGRNTRYNPGQVAEFVECPTHFSSLEEDVVVVDFLNSSPDVLLNSSWSYAAAFTAVQSAYAIDLVRDASTTKANLVSQIMDARDRHVKVEDVAEAK